MRQGNIKSFGIFIMKKNVLGVKIDDVNIDQALEIVGGWLKGSGKYFIVTPNPEFIVSAQDDKDFQDVLNKADLSIPDGVGLKLAGVKNTVAGVDLMERLVGFCSDQAYTIGLLGGGRGVAEKAAECLKGQYHNISVVFADSGGEIDKDGNSIEYSVESIPHTDLLFIAFGHIKQEKWMVQNLSKLPVKVMMGVGGAFDYISGEISRAPFWIRSLGLEWLFRLIIEPWRIRRQFALLKFIWLVLH